MPKPRSLTRTLLSAIAILASLSIIATIAVAHFAPQLLQHFLEKSGITIQNFAAEQPSFGAYYWPRLELDLPLDDSTVHLTAEKLSIAFKPQLSTALFRPDVTADSLTIVAGNQPATSTAPAIGHGHAATWALPINSLRVTQAALELGAGFRSTLSNLVLKRTNSGATIAADIELGDIHLPSFPVTVDVRQNAEAIAATISNGSVFTIRLGHNISTASGEAQLSFGPIRLEKLGSLNSYLPHAPPALQFVQGKLSGNGKATWSKGTLDQSSTLELLARGLEGSYEDIDFTGGEIRLGATASAGDLYTVIGMLQAATVHSGMPISNLAMKGSLKYTPAKSAEVLLDEIRASLFGGSVSAEQIGFLVGTPNLSTTVNLQGIDLSRLLSATGRAVSGTGILDGTIPLEITAQGISIREGTIQSRMPGTIRYLPNPEARAAAQRDAKYALALDALEYFLYEELSAKVQYEPNGEMHTEVSFLGHNPKVLEGRSFRFNLDLSENIPALLRSLRLATEAGKDTWKPQ